MENIGILTESKYIKPSREKVVFPLVSVTFFFAYFVLPQYFGLPFPLFDFTVLRLMIIFMLLFILGIKQRQQDFMKIITEAPFSRVLIPYLIVLSYTMVLRVDINAFINPVIELISFYILVYVIKHCFGIKKTLGYIIAFSYILTLLGLVEYAIQSSPFSYLETIPINGINIQRFIRSGYYRIMGPGVHSLGYGLMLITMVPVICYDIEKEEINILKNKVLFIMVTMNIFFTGSRSALSIFLMEVVMLAFLSTKTNKKKLILLGGLFIVVFVAFLIVLHNTSIAQYIMLQITSVVDEILGTTYSAKYGADLNALGSSSNYRDQLKYIFQVDWLNPLVGLGRNKRFSCEINGSFIHSVDSFYIADYIRYAYPGMISYILFLVYFLFRMLKDCIVLKSQISKMLFVGALGYCISLLWVDSLQTLKYLYILFAIYCCLPESYSGEMKVREQALKKLKSKYLK